VDLSAHVSLWGRTWGFKLHPIKLRSLSPAEFATVAVRNARAAFQMRSHVVLEAEIKIDISINMLILCVF